MREMTIEKGIIIDNLECVLEELQQCTGRRISDLECMRKFICTEKHTKFYFDEKLKSSENKSETDIYLWLDTGYRDMNKKTLFLSMLKEGTEYVGHYVGSAANLANGAKKHFPAQRKHIQDNYSRFLKKYNSKIEERATKYIENEELYYIEKVNEDFEMENFSEISKKLAPLKFVFEVKPEEKEEPEVQEIFEEETFSAAEEQITIGLLLDIIASKDNYIKELEEELERANVEKTESMRILQEENREISEEITRLRNFYRVEQELQEKRILKKKEKEQGQYGHSLLERNKKILVLGDSRLSVEDMKGIAKKDFGFGKRDFEFETDYNKVVNAAGRVINGNRFQAIIFGCCPHSVKDKGKWSSIIEMFKKSEGYPIVVDARSLSGEVKVTKESFRKALDEICESICTVA